MPRTPNQLHPLLPARGFGFEEIMRKPDHARFPKWYERTTRLGEKTGR